MARPRTLSLRMAIVVVAETSQKPAIFCVVYFRKVYLYIFS
jgi:hypothetical protein